MALSGYVFANPTSILPYLEDPDLGPTPTLAKSLAKRLRCHVVAGYPENLERPLADKPADAAGAPSTSTRKDSSDDNAASGPSSMKALEGEALGVGYNSATVVSPLGEVVGNYRKTFLFETDKNWARAGTSAEKCYSQLLFRT